MCGLDARVRDERGATAVLVALLALTLLGVGAFAVDLGQVYAKRAALQSNVDMAVMAAAAELDGSGACTPEAVAAATDYLTKAGNQVADQIAVDLGGAPGDDDGYISCPGWRVELWAPQVEVAFGMAKALSDANTGLNVPAYAAAEIMSPGGNASMPMYAVSGCDSGAQTISDPPPGPAPAPDVPPLTPSSSPTNNASFTVSPTEIPGPTTPDVPMTLSGVRLSGVTTVIFSNADGSSFETAVQPGGSNTSVTIQTVPAEVLSTGGIWYVRVRKSDGSWSSESSAQTFTVGDLMFCEGAVSGNFGTLKIARSDPNWWLEHNIMFGLEPVLDLYPPPATTCDDGVSPAVTSEHAPNDGTNCLGTDPGFPNAAATNGLVEGIGGDPGRLDKDTTVGTDRACGRNGSARTVATPGPNGVALNDDLLTCFFVDRGATIQDAIDGVPEIISTDIFKSPRFFRIPVIPVEASEGSSNFYPIIDFRPGFITEESPSASYNLPDSPGNPYNGLYFQSGHVESLKVVLFDEDAIAGTAPPVGGEIAYTGTGTKVIVMVE